MLYHDSYLDYSSEENDYEIYDIEDINKHMHALSIVSEEDKWNIDSLSKCFHFLHRDLFNIVLSYNILQIEFPEEKTINIMDWDPKVSSYTGFFTKDKWHTQTLFMSKLYQLQQKAARVDHSSLGHCRVDGRKCCDLTGGKFFWANMSWCKNFLTHYVYFHNAVPTREFYNSVMYKKKKEPKVPLTS